MITAEDMLGCEVIFCLQLKKEAFLICVASFMGWVAGAFFIWLCKNVQVIMLVDDFGFIIVFWYVWVFDYIFLF